VLLFIAIRYLRYLSSGENLAGCGILTTPPQYGQLVLFNVYFSQFTHLRSCQTNHLSPLEMLSRHYFLRSAFFGTLLYSRTAWTSPLIFALPPEGSARVSPHTLQVILLTALLKRSCSLPHFWHLTLRKTLLGFGISLFQSDIIFFSFNITVLPVFLDGYRLCGAYSYILCILGAGSVFWLFWRIHAVKDIFARHNPLSRVRGGVHLWRELGVFLPCRGKHCEPDELYILDNKS
jgi:hypothetical protein